MRRRLTPSLMLLALLAASPAGAMPAVFDFEDETVTSGGALPRHPGDLTALVMSRAGLTVTITRESGEAFDVHLSPGFPLTAFGQQALDPFSFSASDTAMIVNFSRGVSAVSVDMGDFGDDGDTLSLEAWSGADASGVQLSSDVGSLPSSSNTDFGFATLSVTSATPIFSVRMIGGSEFFPNSVFYDNLTVTPEPTTGTLLMLVGVAALGARTRDRSRS